MVIKNIVIKTMDSPVIIILAIAAGLMYFRSQYDKNNKKDSQDYSNNDIGDNDKNSSSNDGDPSTLVYTDLLGNYTGPEEQKITDPRNYWSEVSTKI